MKTKKPKPIHQEFVDRYFGTNKHSPTWHEGFLEAIGLIEYELDVSELSAKELSDVLKQATEEILKLDEAEAES